MNDLADLRAISLLDANLQAKGVLHKRKRCKSEKLSDPTAFFSGWAYRIEPHHWATLGITKRTFVKNKKPYMSWAIDEPCDYAFDQGYIFYSVKKDCYVQIVSINTDHLEVHTGLVKPGHARHSYKIMETELVKWFQTGEVPLETSRLSRGEGKSGTFAWMIAGPDDSRSIV